MAGALGDPARRETEEARELQVRHQNHHADQQHDGVEVDGTVGILEAERLEADHEARTHERGTRTVEAQARQAAKRHHGVGAEKDDERGDHGGLLGSTMAFLGRGRASKVAPSPLPPSA